MKFILARKDRMTQIFDDQGRVWPGTVLKTGPLEVTQVKTPETDGYAAVQVGFGEQKEARVNKAQLGHAKGKAFQVMKEFRSEAGDLAVGSAITPDVFEAGDEVTVSGTSKGK
ncbi:MAG: 50S ribosomal protein L3, partial [Patescibacteria group bacterium]